MGTTCFVFLFFVLPVNTTSVFDVITIDDPNLKFNELRQAGLLECVRVLSKARVR